MNANMNIYLSSLIKKIIGNFGDDFPLWINLTGSVDGKPCIQLRYMLSIGTKHIRVIMNLNFINNEFEMYSINPKFGYSTDLRNDINPREEKCWDDFVNLIEYNQML